MDQFEQLNDICCDFDTWELFETEIYHEYSALWDNPYDHID